MSHFLLSCRHSYHVIPCSWMIACNVPLNRRSRSSTAFNRGFSLNFFGTGSMVKCIATARSSLWRRPESAAAFRSGSQNTRPHPTATPWGRSKIYGGERSEFLTRKPFRAFLTKANFLCSLKEATSGDKHGFVSQISDHSWKEMVAGMPQGRKMKRDESRWPCWQSGSENSEGFIRSKDFRRRRSTFSRISLPRPHACLARPSALVRDVDLASAPLESTARKRIEASPLSEIPDLHLKEEDLRVEQKHDHADEPRMGHPVLKDENRQWNDGSFKEPPNPYPSVEHSTRPNFSHEIEFSNLQGDKRKKFVWEFACALAHAYLHQKDVEERLLVGAESLLPGPNRVVEQDFEMAKPWDEHVLVENEEEERENSSCDRKTSSFLSAGEGDRKPTEKEAGVCGVHGLRRKRSEMLMDEVVNPTQAAAWLGTHVTAAAAAVLASS